MMSSTTQPAIGITLTDEKLFELCRKYGEIALKYRRKFVGLLPEVYKRELYRKKGFSSIFEFAAKLAGISEQQVRDALNLEKRFEDKPVLHELLVNGKVSVSKLAKIASIATTENQDFLAEQVKLLPRTALETLARDYRIENQNGLLKPENTSEVLPGNSNLSQNGEMASTDGSCHCEPHIEIRGKLREAISNKSIQDDAKFSEIECSENLVPLSLRAERSNLISPSGELNLSEEVQQKLLELQQKGIDINQLILKLLSEREETIEEEKEEIGVEAQDNFIQYNITESRNVSARIKKLFKQEYGKKCSIPGCNKPWSEIHHSQRFSLAKIHDPRYMAPLCEQHHKIAHSIDQKYQERRLAI